MSLHARGQSGHMIPKPACFPRQASRCQHFPDDKSAFSFCVDLFYTARKSKKSVCEFLLRHVFTFLAEGLAKATSAEALPLAPRCQCGASAVAREKRPPLPELRSMLSQLPLWTLEGGNETCYLIVGFSV